MFSQVAAIEQLQADNILERDRLEHLVSQGQVLLSTVQSSLLHVCEAQIADSIMTQSPPNTGTCLVFPLNINDDEKHLFSWRISETREKSKGAVFGPSSLKLKILTITRSRSKATKLAFIMRMLHSEGKDD